MYRIKFSYIIIPLLLFSNIVKANNPDSLHSFNSFKLQKITNFWLESGNITGIAFNTHSKIGYVNTGYFNKNGDLHLIRESNEMGKFFLNTESYQRIKNIDFYGSFSYTNSGEEGMLWNGVFDPYRGNPYIIGDSIPGFNYHKETFQLKGGVSRRISTHLSAGILVDYFVGVGAKQKDPRPKNTVMDISIHPSIIYEFSNTRLGFDAGYSNRKEDINYKVVVGSGLDPIYFKFKGFGFNKNEPGTSFTRFYTEKEYFGGIQIESKFLGMKSLTELRGNYSMEIVEDGSVINNREDGGDWKTLTIEFNHKFVLQKNSNLHTFKIKGAFFDGDGIEYDQKKTTDDDHHTIYITNGKNLKFSRMNISALLTYNYLRMLVDKQIGWDIEAFAGFVMNNEKYHYIPEIFTADYMNVNAGLKAIKNFYLKNNIHLAPEIGASYIYNLSNELFLSNDENLTKKQRKETYVHDFNYYTSDLLKVSGGVTIGFQLKKAKIMDQLYLKAYYERWQTMNEENVGFITGTFGILF